MKSRRYRKRKPRMKRKTRRGGSFLVYDLWGGIQDSLGGAAHTLTGDYPPEGSSILSK